MSVCSHVNHVGARICGGGPAALACSETWTLSSCRIPGLRCLRILVQLQQFLQFHHRLLWVDSAPDEAMSFRRTNSVRIPSWRRGTVGGFRRHDMAGPCDLSTWSRAMEFYDGHSARGVEDPKDETTKRFVGCRGQHPSRRQHLSHEGDLKLLDCWPIKAVIKTRDARCNQCGSRPGKGIFITKKWD